MPVYEYECPVCGVFEHTQSMSDDPLSSCATKGCRRKVKRLISSSSFQLKGGGWYSEGYQKGSGGDSSKDSGSASSADSSSDSSAASSADSSSDSSPSGGSDSSPGSGSSKGSGKSSRKTSAKKPTK